MVPAVKAQSRVSEHTSAFRRKVRSTTVDGASYNDLTEKQIINEREGWSLILFHCFVHCLYGVHKQMYSLMKADISSIVAFALSMKPGGSLVNYRESVMLAIESMLLIVPQLHLSTDAIRYKEFVFDLLLGTSASASEYKTALFKCAPGDWREKGKDKFAFVAPNGTTVKSVLMFLRVHLLPYLVPNMPKPFPRQRWMGATEALGGFIPAFIHGVMQKAYAIFAMKFHGMQQPTASAASSSFDGPLMAIEDVQLDDAGAVGGGVNAADVQKLRYSCWHWLCRPFSHHWQSGSSYLPIFQTLFAGPV
jgi:hypothetical protein